MYAHSWAGGSELLRLERLGPQSWKGQSGQLGLCFFWVSEDPNEASGFTPFAHHFNASHSLSWGLHCGAPDSLASARDMLGTIIVICYSHGSGAAMMDNQELGGGGLKTAGIYFLPVLETRCPKSKFWQGCAASKGAGDHLQGLLTALISGHCSHFCLWVPPTSPAS